MTGRLVASGIALALALAGCSGDGRAVQARDFPDDVQRQAFLKVAGEDLPGWSDEKLVAEAESICSAFDTQATAESWVLQVKRYTDKGMDARVTGGLIAASVATLCPEHTAVLPSS